MFAIIWVAAVFSYDLRAQGQVVDGKNNLLNPPKDQPVPKTVAPPDPETARIENLAKPPVRVIGKGHFEVGDVKIIQAKREVRFPAELNLPEGVVEYLVSAPYGKAHECLFQSKALPYHIHVAMLLMGVEGASKKSLEKVDESKLGGPIRDTIWDSILGDPIDIHVEWEEDGKKIRRRAQDLMRDEESKSAIPDLEWVYNGSIISKEGFFLAQLFGDMISLIPDPAVLVNSRSPIRTGPKMYEIIPENCPPPEVLVEVIFTLLKQDAAPAN